MRNKIVGWLLMKRAEKAAGKHAHRCLSCDEVMSPVRRMSVLNLLVYIVIGVVIGGLTLFKIGFVFAFAAILINAWRIKPACEKCFSTDIHIVQWEELQQWKKEQREKKEALKVLTSLEKEEEGKEEDKEKNTSEAKTLS